MTDPSSGSSSGPKKGRGGPSRFREQFLEADRSERKKSGKSEIPVGRARALLSGSALLNNYRVLEEKCGGGTWMLPMLKADAYGHGARFAVERLKGEESLYGFGVATPAEAVEIRDALGLRDRKKRVILFSGATPFEADRAQFCERYAVEPVLSSRDDLTQFLRADGPGRVAYHLKFNTGMNRLGIPMAQLDGVMKALRDVPLENWPDTVCTHLASADDPRDALTLIQMNRFRELRARFRDKKETMHFHFANSAAIWNAKSYALSEISEIARPGLSLYGVRPFTDAGEGGLRPVLELEYQVSMVQDLPVGERVGYGGTYRVSGKENPNGQRIAVLGAGYADGLSRAFGGGVGMVLARGHARRFLGRVSMDLSTIEGFDLRAGEWVKFLGEGIDPWTQSQSAGTIPYELLTSISNRVTRVVQD